MAKKYIVRTGFVVHQQLQRTDGSLYIRTYNEGEELTLDDSDAELHAHKLEYASQKDRDAALAAEKATKVAQAAAQSPAELVNQLVAALAQAQAAAGAAPTQPAA